MILKITQEALLWLFKNARKELTNSFAFDPSWHRANYKNTFYLTKLLNFQMYLLSGNCVFHQNFDDGRQFIRLQFLFLSFVCKHSQMQLILLRE